MTNSNEQSVQPPRRSDDGWANPVGKIRAGVMPTQAEPFNVEGRELTGPLRGFGQMWHKRFRVRLEGVQLSPEDVIREWRENFCQFWPSGNTFYGSVSKGIEPGEVAVLHLNKVGGLPLISTGIYVLYADDESFAFMTPEGHPVAGIITFSAFRDEDGVTVAQAECIVRANDPIYELGMRLGGGRAEDHFWEKTLEAVAAHFGAHAAVQQRIELLDPKVQWRKVTNVWHNAGARTAIHTVLAPLRRFRKPAR